MINFNSELACYRSGCALHTNSNINFDHNNNDDDNLPSYKSVTFASVLHWCVQDKVAAATLWLLVL